MTSIETKHEGLVRAQAFTLEQGLPTCGTRTTTGPRKGLPGGTPVTNGDPRESEGAEAP